MQLGFLMLTDHSEVLNGKVYAMGGRLEHAPFR